MSNQEKPEMTIQIVEKTSKKTGKPYTAVEVRVGRWSGLIFPRSSFELDYLSEVLSRV